MVIRHRIRLYGECGRNSKNLFDTKTLKQHKMQVQYSKQILNSATIFKLSLTLNFCLAFDSKLTDILKNHIAS